MFVFKHYSAEIAKKVALQHHLVPKKYLKKQKKQEKKKTGALFIILLIFFAFAFAFAFACCEWVNERQINHPPTTHMHTSIDTYIRVWSHVIGMTAATAEFRRVLKLEEWSDGKDDEEEEDNEDEDGDEDDDMKDNEDGEDEDGEAEGMAPRRNGFFRGLRFRLVSERRIQSGSGTLFSRYWDCVIVCSLSTQPITAPMLMSKNENLISYYNIKYKESKDTTSTLMVNHYIFLSHPHTTHHTTSVPPSHDK